MEQLAEVLVSRLLQMLDALFPTRSVREFGMFTWNDVYAALVIVSTAVLLGVALGYALRRRSAVAAKLDSAANVSHRVLTSVSRPLYAIIGLYAIYFASLPFVLRSQKLGRDCHLACGAGRFFRSGCAAGAAVVCVPTGC
jgi:hypothetical protein